jgi:hypothetical protein
MIGRMLFEEGIGFLYYVDEVTNYSKNKVIKTFSTNLEVQDPGEFRLNSLGI